MILAIELLLAIVGLLVGYQIGIYIVIVGYICGFLLPLLMYDKFQAGQVNFPHLVERVSLIVIIAFGEAIVNLASYFNSETPITYAVLLFVSLCSMFASYVNFSEKIINHHQVSKGFVLMYSHIALVAAILMTTVATLYLNSKAIKLTFVAWFIIASLALLILIFIIGAVFTLALHQSRVAMMIILFVWNAAYAIFVGIKSSSI
ncbi:hypothetical protein LANSK_11450 [Lactobacillus amylovorus subsp. amylovorus]|nr:hypothetical protein LAYK10_13510 [Lactobacillus amylovorus]